MSTQTCLCQRIFLILLYFLPIPGLPWLLRRKLWPEVNGEFITQAEYLLVQAFGRDNLPDKVVVTTLDDLFSNDYSSILRCMRLLQKLGFEPGVANHALAQVQRDYMNRSPQMVAISQWEVCYAHWLQDKMGFGINIERIEPLWPKGEYFATVHVKKAAKAIILRRGLSLHNGIELAHPDMVIRAKLILWRLGLDPAISLVRTPYAPSAVQWWVRSWWLWTPHEILGRAYRMLKRWTSFSPPVR